MSDHNTKTLFPQYQADHASFATLRAWRKSLENDRGERAYLRRAATLTEIMLSPAFHRLLAQLGRNKVHPVRYPKLALIAGLVARIEEENGQRLGAQMGSPHKAATKPDVAELRMRRILACDDLEELYALLRRALAVLGNQANIADLAAVVWNWTPMDEKSPHDPRRRLAYDYYAEMPL